jgi:hypothetical protein
MLDYVYIPQGISYLLTTHAVLDRTDALPLLRALPPHRRFLITAGGVLIVATSGCESDEGQCA